MPANTYSPSEFIGNVILKSDAVKRAVPAGIILYSMIVPSSMFVVAILNTTFPPSTTLVLFGVITYLGILDTDVSKIVTVLVNWTVYGKEGFTKNIIVSKPSVIKSSVMPIVKFAEVIPAGPPNGV